MRTFICCMAVAGLAPSLPAQDTIRIDVGSPLLDGRMYAPHKARVNVRVGDSTRIVATWTNELTLDDSAGRPLMRWVTLGTQQPGTPGETTWELRQTYDARTLAPLRYALRSSGGQVELALDGTRVRGTRRTGNDPTVHAVDVTLDRPGFFAGASDLVPLAVRGALQPGVVITAPFWSPAMTAAERRIFTVVGLDTVDVEGTAIAAWKVEERRGADRVLLATWWLLDESPYMVYGEVITPGGQVRQMTEVEIPLR